MEQKWFAVYLFYPGELDEVLLGLIAPLTDVYLSDRRLVPSYFFIRYWEGGSHIRLRVKTDAEQWQVILKQLEERADKLFTGYDLTAAVYAPEIERYGDERSIYWAERHFFQSSVFVLNYICTRKNGASVLIQALRMQLILLFAAQLEMSRLTEIGAFFINGWLPRLYTKTDDFPAQKTFWLNEFENSFKRTKEFILPASLAFWEELNTGTADKQVMELLKVDQQIMLNYLAGGFGETKITEIMTSIMHMDNNRLGISNYEEAYGMYCTMQCLDFIAQNVFF